MPSGGGGVYQPTTVSYDTRSYSSAASPLNILEKPGTRTLLLLFSIIAILGGLTSICCGMTDYLEKKERAKAMGDVEIAGGCFEMPLGVIVGGVLMICTGLVALGVFFKITDFRRDYVCACPCSLLEKNMPMTPKLHGQSLEGCNQGIIALNPCKDPFIPHPQFTPGSKMPTLRLEDEELRNLMPTCRECISSAEESDRMLEPDPRIVLRPMGRVEDI